MQPKLKLFMLGALVSLALAALACGPLGGQQATVQALAAQLDQTATALASTGSDAESMLATAQAQATQRSLDVTATQAAQQLQGEEAAAATAAAVQPIEAELVGYGVDPAQGHVQWIHPPIHIEVEGYQSVDYANNFIATVVSDFVISTDITWDTTTGLAGCGFVLRSDGNEEALNEYLVVISRGGNGTAYFVTQSRGAFFREQYLYPGGIDPQFDWRNGTTNRLAVVGRGNTFTVYTNGTRIGTITDNTYERGFVAMAALSESGRTVCDFNNSWLWLFD